MGSYHSRQTADLVLLLSKFSFFSKTNCLANILIFCRYIDDGFMLTNRAELSNIITNLCSSYPSQIPTCITFTSNHNTTHYLDLTLSLNHFTITRQSSLSSIPKTTSQIHVSTFFIQSSTTHFHWYHKNWKQYDTFRDPRTTITLYTNYSPYD